MQASHDVVGCGIDLYERCTLPVDGLALASTPTLHKRVHDLVADDPRGIDAAIHFAALSNNLRRDLAVACSVTTGLIYLNSDGTPWRPTVRIEDISRTFMVALQAAPEIVAGHAFNVGRSGDNYRILDIAEAVAQVVPGCRIEIANDSGTDERLYRVNSARIAGALPNFAPHWTVELGTKQLYDAYLAAGMTREELRRPALPAHRPDPFVDVR